MNTHEANQVYKQGGTDSVIRFAEHLVSALGQEPKKRVYVETLVQKTRDEARTFQLQAEREGFVTEEHGKQLDRIAFAFCGFMAAFMLMGIIGGLS